MDHILLVPRVVFIQVSLLLHIFWYILANVPQLATGSYIQHFVIVCALTMLRWLLVLRFAFLYYKCSCQRKMNHAGFVCSFWWIWERVFFAVYIIESKFYIIESKVYITESKVYIIESKVYIIESKVYIIESKFYITESKVYIIESKFLSCCNAGEGRSRLHWMAEGSERQHGKRRQRIGTRKCIVGNKKQSMYSEVGF